MESNSCLDLNVTVTLEYPVIAILDTNKVSDDFIDYLVETMEDIYRDKSSSRSRVKALRKLIEEYQEDDSIYDDQVHLTLENTGSPVRNYPYKAVLPSGKIISGKTDYEGKTKRLRDANTQNVIIYWG